MNEIPTEKRKILGRQHWQDARGWATLGALGVAGVGLAIAWGFAELVRVWRFPW
jgi:hypothetical protein